MPRFLYLLILVFFFNVTGLCQSVDTAVAPVPDTAKPVKPARPKINIPRDSAVASIADTAVPQIVVVDDTSLSTKPTLIKSRWEMVAGKTFSEQVLSHHPYFNYTAIPVVAPSQIKLFRGKELLFYVIVALFVIFALLKMIFAKYYHDLFRVFFRTTMKQRQIREQLMQTPLPSLLFNIFFVATAGLYLAFIFEVYEYKFFANFWFQYFYCCLGLAVIYTFKFIGLKVCGWLFNMRQAADSYIFIVFIINKVIGIFLLPILALLAFSEGIVNQVSLTLSWLGIGILLFYRFILGYGVVRNEVRFNLFHFFLYLCAFEVAPLLLIYRVLLFVFK